jgi:proteasome lid subunit RPN8/RPN11
VTHGAESLALPESARADIIAHARDHTPRECCGIIAGRNGKVTQVHRLTNTEPGNTRYLFDDEEFFKLYWELENRGETLLSVYHSHPATVAYPSKTDVEFALWPEAVYVICSLEHQNAPVIRGFRIVDGEITEVTIA